MTTDIVHGTWERIGIELRLRINMNHDLPDGRTLKTKVILSHAEATWAGTYEAVS